MVAEIEIAKTSKQYEAGGQLILAYAEFLGHDLEFQGFCSELRSLPEMYGPPKGALLLAKLDGNYVGTVGLRESGPDVAEMKRMYVLPEYQGRGIGNLLSKAFIEQAAQLGYSSIRLDSIPELDKALRLYQRLGFEEIEAYRFNPHPDAVFMEYKIS